MKQLLQQYAAFNYWANKKLVDFLQNIDGVILAKEMPASFPTIQRAILHLWEAESIWWQRLKLAEHVISPADKFEGDFEELSKMLLTQSFDWQQWVKNANEPAITHVFAYRNTKKEEFKQPVNEMLMHVFNHQTYHRGQVVMMLRSCGIDKIPPTDFMVFARKKL